MTVRRYVVVRGVRWPLEGFLASRLRALHAPGCGERAYTELILVAAALRWRQAAPSAGYDAATGTGG